MSRKSRSDLSRRALLKGLAAAGSLAAVGSHARTNGAENPVVLENHRTGSRDWMLDKPRIDADSRYRCPWIEGYASRNTVAAGDRLSFHVSARPASSFTIEIFRSGYYGGEGGRKVMELGPFAGKPQPVPSAGAERLRECRWEPCAEVTIPEDWVSGVYLGKLTVSEGGWQSYLIFIVRDRRPADFLFQCSDFTWQAYNRWPRQDALYDDGENEWYCGPGVSVSFDRPYGKYCQILDAPLSTGSGSWFLWEFPLAYWMESRGYDVSYISNLDTHTDARGLRRAKGFLSVGHDEYYTLDMYGNLKAARDAGVNLAFLSGDTCWGRVALRASGSGAPNRVFSRIDAFGPRLPNGDWAGTDGFPYRTPSESELIGARNVPPVTGGADWICAAPEHWLYDGTGMRQGDRVPGLIGWEWMGMPADIPGLRVLATGPTANNNKSPKGRGIYTATIYSGPKGNFVFNAATCWWADGLSEPPGYVRPKVYTEPQGPDLRVQRMTANLLDRMR